MRVEQIPVLAEAYKKRKKIDAETIESVRKRIGQLLSERKEERAASDKALKAKDAELKEARDLN